MKEMFGNLRISTNKLLILPLCVHNHNKSIAIFIIDSTSFNDEQSISRDYHFHFIIFLLHVNVKGLTFDYQVDNIMTCNSLRLFWEF